MVNIVVIDTGISNSYISCRNKIERMAFSYNHKMSLFEKCCDTNDYVGHGTSVINIIDNKVLNAKIISFKVDMDTISGSGIELIEALKYIYNEVPCDIINISCGVCSSLLIEDFNRVSKQISSRGTIIVSAFDNNGGISYPAALDDVIGVDFCRDLRFGEFAYIQNSIVNIKYGLGEQYVLNANNACEVVVGNSFFAPIISAIIAQFLMSNNIDKKNRIPETYDYLRQIASRIETVNAIENICLYHDLKIKKAVLFPYNKEIDCLLRNKDLLEFEILGIYDSKYNGNMSKTMHGFPVINIDKINWNDEFDTLILGHLEELELKTKKDYGALLIKRCLEMQKNIVLFDSAFSEERNNLLSSAKAVKVYYPDNNRVLNNISRMENKLFSFATPILAVLGTSSKQGKMSLQLDLRRLFMNAGYIIGQFGTEPSSMLFGFDEVYVMGYNSNCSHDSEKNILSINSLNKNNTNVDAIMTKEYSSEGVVFSQGEFQALNLARPFFEETGFVVLDEPSSSLDPIAEYEMLMKMVAISNERSMVFVSHRLSMATLADKIVVLKEGKICEIGKHSELMRQNGIYAKMFNLQAQGYKEGAVQ